MAYCASDRLASGFVARSISRRSLACLRSCTSDGRAGSRAGLDMGSPFGRARVRKVGLKEDRVCDVDSLQVGSALSADGVRPGRSDTVPRLRGCGQGPTTRLTRAYSLALSPGRERAAVTEQFCTI